FGGLVEEESLSCTLETKDSKIQIMCIFYKGQIVFYSPSIIKGSYIHSESSSEDILSQAKAIIQRYQSYVTQKYSTNDLPIESIQDILNNVTALSPINKTIGNVNLQISMNEGNTNIQLSYSENDLSIEQKGIKIGFYNNTLIAFVDTWNLYAVSGPSEISSDEAMKIALEAAKNYNLTIFNIETNQTTNFKPELSETIYDIGMTMIPGHSVNPAFQGENTAKNPSNIPRNPLTLYPLWQFHFYFNTPVGNVVGIEVGVWGDTKEIFYCDSYGFYGASDLPTEHGLSLNQSQSSPSTETKTTPTTSAESTTQQQINTTVASNLDIIIVEIATITIVAVALMSVVLKKRSK
ncbi:MAG: hypothetical protein GX638_02055, partial [Crenarchaeota archaeon]|nr:hypothetical protein [Thermoproteota archaeon]